MMRPNHMTIAHGRFSHDEAEHVIRSLTRTLTRIIRGDATTVFEFQVDKSFYSGRPAYLVQMGEESFYVVASEEVPDGS